MLSYFSQLTRFMIISHQVPGGGDISVERPGKRVLPMDLAYDLCDMFKDGFFLVLQGKEMRNET